MPVLEMKLAILPSLSQVMSWMVQVRVGFSSRRESGMMGNILEADIYSNEALVGRGGWNWYTGSSSWLYKAILEYVLGLKIQDGFLRIEPCISKDWKEYEIKYKYKTSIYNIKVKNNNSKNTGVTKFILNDEEILEKKVLLQDNCKIYNIEIFM